MQKVVVSELKEARPRVKKYLESALLSLIGLEKRYGSDFEIDHCNSRNSVLIDAFRELAIDEAKKMASEYKPNKDQLSAYKKTFESEIRDQFSYVIRDLAKQKAAEIASKIVQDIRVDVDDILENQFGEKPKEEISF